MKTKKLLIISGIFFLLVGTIVFIHLLPQESITFTSLPPVYLKEVVIP